MSIAGSGVIASIALFGQNPIPIRMSIRSDIQWCDSTVNPVMGCDGCPLYPSSTVLVANQISDDLAAIGTDPLVARALLAQRFGELPFSEIYHRRDELGELISADLKAHGIGRQAKAGVIVSKGIASSLRCYAGVLHSRYGENPLKPDKKLNPGYARRFEQVTQFPGRMLEASKWKDLSGTAREDKPWLVDFPRLIFVSDMGDALSIDVPFDYLRQEIIDVVQSEMGKAHVWLWLSKLPRRMAVFSDWLVEQGIPWPDNLVPMTSVLDPDMAVHVKHLKRIPAKVRGLSVEPLWGSVDIDLDEIDWVIVGGESGHQAKPFDLKWARSLRDRCREEGTAFFMKQLGAKPEEDGKRIKLEDAHGGNWEEWPEDLRIRELPEKFHRLAVPREKRPTAFPAKKPLARERKDFERLNGIVIKSVAAFIEAGEALKEIRDRDLWLAGGFPSWDDYCRHAAGMSRVHANRLIASSDAGKALSGVKPIGSTQELPSPQHESQLRPLLKLDESKRQEVWALAVEKSGGRPTAKDVTKAVAEVVSSETAGAPGKVTLREKRIEIVASLRDVVQMRRSWDAVEKLLAQLEEVV